MNEIEQAYRSGYRTVLAQLPTGFGKSPLAMAVARFMGNSYFCTATKDLQHQYERDFKFVKVVKGRSNFECIEATSSGSNYDLFGNREIVDCDHGRCVIDGSFNCAFKPEQDGYAIIRDANGLDEQVAYTGTVMAGELCKYYDQKYSALAASHAVFNYRMFLMSMSSPASSEGLKPRACLVADECHMLESELTEYRSVTISKHKLMQFLDRRDAELPQDCGYNVEKWLGYIKNICDQLDEFIDSNLSSMSIGQESENKKRRHASSMKGLYEAKRLLDRLKEATDDIEYNPLNWIVSSLETDHGDVSGGGSSSGRISRVTLKPTSVRSAASRFFAMGRFRLLMSATVLSKEDFCNIVGLEPSEVKWIEAGSDFPVESRPIYALNMGQLNAKNQQIMLPRFVSKIDEIMTLFARHKGIIHVTSYAQLRAIREGLSQPNRRRLLETGDGVQREELVREHASAKDRPTVLISPSLHTGLDLKDDLARFQIIVKVPYPDLSDRLIDAKRRRSERWYTYQTALRMVQAYGRAVRSKDDWAATFVLDSNFRGFFWTRAQAMLPAWFKEAVVDVPKNGMLPQPGMISLTNHGRMAATGI
jgi:Rad3-related DNA helicase